MCFRPTRDQQEDIARDDGYATALRDVTFFLKSGLTAQEWALKHGREHFNGLFKAIEQTYTRQGG